MPYFTTPPLRIIDEPADDQHKGGNRLGYRVIVIHATGGTNSLAWLSKTSRPPVSIHRLIRKDGQIFKIVPDDEVAWHAGPATIGRLPARNAQGAIVESVNNWSLGIELENLNDGRDPYSLPQIASCVLQVREWWGLYGAIAIASHAGIQSNKHDPAGFPWPEFYRQLFARLDEVI